MRKAIFITRLALTLIFMVVGIYYIDEVKDARFDYLWSAFNSDGTLNSYNSYNSFSGNETSDLTSIAGLITLFYLLLMQASNIFALIQIKTTTVKVLSIIGLSCVGILIIINLLMLSSPEGMSYDEVGPMFVLYAFGAIGFGIVYLIHAIRVEK